MSKWAGFALLAMWCFGGAAAPLIWSRFSAAIAKLGDTILKVRRCRLQIYLDDPLFTLQGSLRVRNKILAVCLLVWQACGLRIAWSKGQRGDSVDWIGLLFSVDIRAKQAVVRVPDSMTSELKSEAVAIKALEMVPLKRLKRFTSRSSWVANLLARMRWLVNRLWATITDTERKAAAVRSGLKAPAISKHGGQKLYLVATCRVATPLKWIAQFWGSVGPGFSRKFGYAKQMSKEDVVIDACPWRIGGRLEHTSSGTPLEFFADALNDQDASRMRTKIGDAAGQAAWETLAVLVALRIWANFFRDRRVRLRVRSDSSAALSLAIKMASTSPIMNGLGAEIALTLELYDLEELFTEHLPGKLNVRADILSRVWAPVGPGEIPSQFAGIKR